MHISLRALGVTAAVATVALGMVGPAPAATAAPKAGAKCTAKQVGSTVAASGGGQVTCTKKGSKTSWQKVAVTPTTAAVTAATAAPATTAATAAPKGVPGISDKTIKIGLTGPYTGSAAVAGQGLRAGVQIAVDEVNAAGGIAGRKVELVALDDGFDIPKLVANVRRLVDDEKVYAIVGAAGSQALPGTYDFLKDRGTILWGPVTPPDPKLPGAFILGPSRATQIRVAVDFLCEKGVKRVALIGQDNNLGAEGKAGVTIQLPKCAGMELVADERVQQGSREVATAVNKAVQGKAEAVLLATDNTQAALILKKLKELGASPIVVAESGAGGAGGGNTVGQAGSDANGFYAMMAQDLPASDVTRGVIKWRVLAKASGYPGGENNFSLQTYGYAKIFFEVLAKVAATNDFSYSNFTKIAESTKVNLDFMPPIACGPLPDGHACGNGAGIGQYTGKEWPDGRWDQVRDFKAPK